MALLALMNSAPFRFFVSLQMAFGSFEIGVIQRTPLPVLSSGDLDTLGDLARTAWLAKRELDNAVETSHAFVAPALLTVPGMTLAERAAERSARVRLSDQHIAAVQAEIDDTASRLYGLDTMDRGLWAGALAAEIPASGDTPAEEADDPLGGEDAEEEADSVGTSALTANLLAYIVGCVYGRWNIGYGIGELAEREPPDPFAPLPICPPGMLQGEGGIPAGPSDVADTYAIRIAWDGILVDDPRFDGARPHPNDIVQRVREVLDVLWKDKAYAIEQEACEYLGVKDLRDYFRRPAGFFQDHLRRYSKARRKAPIYWPLSTASGSYTIWLCYHRLTDQTLYEAVNKYLDPKITEIEQAKARIDRELDAVSGRDGTRLRDQLSELVGFAAEMRALREELLRITALPYKPDLNDGIIINAAPLHKLFRLRAWANDTHQVWKKLENGDYDWAHLAYTLWQKRVKESCRKDRSIAIAHDFETLCEVEPPVAEGRGKGKRRKAVKI